MTTATLTLEDLTITVACTDEDGQIELITVQVVAATEGYVVEVIQDGDVINHETAATLEEAEQVAIEMAKDVEAEDRRMARERAKAKRIDRKDSILGVASDMDGFDAAALKVLARLVASGRGEAALLALKGLAK